MCFRSARVITCCFFFFNDTATTEIYTLSLHDALPISRPPAEAAGRQAGPRRPLEWCRADRALRARRRARGRLRGDPPDARADRRLGPRGGRARRGPLGSLGFA